MHVKAKLAEYSFFALQHGGTHQQSLSLFNNVGTESGVVSCLS
jgi:hypothetical protein